MLGASIIGTRLHSDHCVTLREPIISKLKVKQAAMLACVPSAAPTAVGTNAMKSPCHYGQLQRAAPAETQQHRLHSLPFCRCTALLVDVGSVDRAPNSIPNA